MADFLVPYSSTICTFAAIGALMILQMLVADLAGMKAGHVPGAPLEADHRRFDFRAARAHANTNESIAVFIVLALFGIFIGANPQWLGWAAWAYIAARIGHMLFYYVGQGMLRSTMFTLGLLAQIAMLIVGIVACLR